MIEPTSHSANMGETAPAAASPQGLADRSKLALIAFDRTHMSMVVTDPNQPDNPVVLANQAFLDLVGYPAEDVIGRNCRFMQGPDTAAEDIAAIRGAIANRHEVTTEILNYRKDGSSYWNEVHISPVFDVSGRLIYFFGTQVDVTRRRRALELERAENALLREVDHRAKNALALVQGIVRLTKAGDIAQYARAVQGRVNALANAHVLLAGGNWRAVPIDQLVRAELRTVDGSRVDLSGPPIDVEVPQVQPFALVLHEIVANAVQHGALSAPSGSLTIRWHREGDGLTIDFSERGGPATAAPAQRGFGLSVADAIVASQLNGHVHRDWQAAGLDCRLTMPCTV